MPGMLTPVAPMRAEDRLDDPSAFWNATYSAMPGTSFATHIEPFMVIVRSFIIAAASGGICDPVTSAMLIDEVNAYSSHLMPSMTCDLPVGVTDASAFTA